MPSWEWPSTADSCRRESDAQGRRLRHESRDRLNGWAPCRGRLSQFHQITIDANRSLSAFGNRPDYQRLATPHISGREYAGNRRHAIFVGRNIPARVERNSKLINHSAPHRADEAHRKQYQVGLHREFGAANRFEPRWRSHANGMQLLNTACRIPG